MLESGPALLTDPAQYDLTPDKEDLSAFYTDAQVELTTIDLSLNDTIAVITAGVDQAEAILEEALPVMAAAQQALFDMGAAQFIDGVGDAGNAQDPISVEIDDAIAYLPAESFMDPPAPFVPPGQTAPSGGGTGKGLPPSSLGN